MQSVITLIAVLLASIPPAQNTAGDAGSPKNRPSVVVLGVFHFEDEDRRIEEGKPGKDILSPEGQKELDELLESLARYGPTKIMVEAGRTEHQESMVDPLYRQYLDGGLDISDEPNEIFQIAFRLGKKLNMTRLWAYDSDVAFIGPEDAAAFDDEYIERLGQYDKSRRHDYPGFFSLSDSLKLNMPLTRYLKITNSEPFILKNHQLYLTDLSIRGAGDSYAGANIVANWYKRNIRMFANIYDLADFGAEEEKLLIIVGSGHLHILRQFFRDSPDFEYIEAGEFL